MRTLACITITLFLCAQTACVYHHTDQQEENNKEDNTTVQFDMDVADSLDFSDSSYITERKKIGLGEAKSASLDISIPAGILSVKGGSNDLVQMAVRYKSGERSFNISQELQGDHLKAEIDMPFRDKIKDVHDDGMACSIRLNEKIPMDLEINLGAGEGKFDLGSINAGSIKMGLGAGEFDINLTGSPATNLKVDAGVGKATVKLNGDRTKDMDAEFNCGIGSLDIILPANYGVKVDISGLLGGISADDLIKEGDSRYNEAWEKEGPKLRIKINGGIGDISLKVE